MKKAQGFALVTVLIMGVVLAALLAAYFSTTITEVNTTRAAANSASGFYAAEAGLNLRAEEIRQKFQGYSRPTAADLVGKSYTLSNDRTVATTATELVVADADAYTIINNPDDDFNGLASVNHDYKVSSVAKNKLGDTEAQLDMQITSREIPVFQFLGFHQESMEFDPGPPMTIHGRVHSNNGLYLSANSGLSIDGQVSGVTTIKHGLPNSCPPGPVSIMGRDGTYKPFGGCKAMSKTDPKDLAPFGGLVKYLDQPLAVPPPESFEWKTTTGFYWQRAELRLVLNQGRYVDLFAAAGRVGDKPEFFVPSEKDLKEAKKDKNKCKKDKKNKKDKSKCVDSSVALTVWAPEIEVRTPTGSVDPAATKKLYSLMVDNPGMITVNLPRNGRTDNGRPNSNSENSPADDGANDKPNLTNKYLSTSYAAAAPPAPNFNELLIPRYCQTYTDLPRPWNANSDPTNLNYNHQDVRGKVYTYPNGWPVDTLPPGWDIKSGLTPEDVYTYFTDSDNPSNLADVCEATVARGEFYHYRQNREMFLLNVNVRQLLEANKNASASARLFDPAVDSPNGGLVIYLSVDGARHTPSPTATAKRDKGNNYGVRLFDGADFSVTKGVTFITDQAAYVQGDFNCRAFAKPGDVAKLSPHQSDTGNLVDSGNPVSNLQPKPQRCHERVSDASGNPLRDTDIENDDKKRGVAVIADSVNILSDAWKDQNSRQEFVTFTTSSGTNNRLPSMTQQNFALVAGSNKSGEGGLHNFPRFLENWDYLCGNCNVRYRYRGSLVAFQFPQRVDGLFSRNVSPKDGCCSTNYKPPIRDWDFDLDFQDAEKLPPLTPRAVSIKQDLFLRDFEQQ